MIEYVISQSPDYRILKRASDLLNQGGLIAFPTDTNWVVACDPFVKGGVERIYNIRREDPSKHFSILCDSISRATEVASIYDEAFRIIRNKVPGHFTFIFEASKKVTKALKASRQDREVGIRFPPNKLVENLIEVHNNVLLSANVTHEMLGFEDKMIEIYAYLIEDSLGHQIEMILDPSDYEFVGSSTIVNFVDKNNIEIVREGAGDLTGLL